MSATNNRSIFLDKKRARGKKNKKKKKKQNHSEKKEQDEPTGAFPQKREGSFIFSIDHQPNQTGLYS